MTMRVLFAPNHSAHLTAHLRHDHINCKTRVFIAREDRRTTICARLTVERELLQAGFRSHRGHSRRARPSADLRLAIMGRPTKIILGINSREFRFVLLIMISTFRKIHFASKIYFSCRNRTRKVASGTFQEILDATFSENKFSVAE